MIKAFNNNKIYELALINDIPDHLKFSHMNENEVNILFTVINKYYNNIYKFKPAVGYSSLGSYKVLVSIADSVPVLDISNYDKKSIRSYVHKFLYGITYFYFKSLIPMNLTPTFKFRVDLADTYYTIFFRILSKYIYVNKLTLPDSAFLYFLVGRLFATKIIDIDYDDHFKYVKRHFKYIDSTLQEIPEKVSFELVIKYLKDYNLLIKDLKIVDLQHAMNQYVSIYAESIMEDPYYYLAFVFSNKIKSPVMNTTFNKYNMSVFRSVNRELTSWIEKVPSNA